MILNIVVVFVNSFYIFLMFLLFTSIQQQQKQSRHNKTKENIIICYDITHDKMVFSSSLIS